MTGHLGYQSGWTDDVTGQVNMAARWYNPATGQFHNKDTAGPDPIPDSAQANPFAYVGDNPLLGTDPSGHCWTGFGWACKAAGAINHYVVQPIWHGIQYAYHKVSSGVSWAVRHTRDLISSIDHELASFAHQIRVWEQEIRDLAHELHVQEQRAKAAAKRAAQLARKRAAAAKKRAIDLYNKTYNLGKYAVKYTEKAVHTTATFIQHHGAAIASIALSTVTFVGCEAALGVGTGGVGAVAGAAGCGMLAGMVGGAIDQGAKCIHGQKGACSTESFGKSMLIGGIGGAVGGAIGGSLGGKLAQSALGKLLPELATDAIEGAAVGGLTGGTTSGLDYGLTCRERTGGCSWSGAAGAMAKGAAAGAIGGAAGGAIGGRLFNGKQSCHSFTATTPVLLANGSAKPISKLKKGDKVLASVPGGHTETHTVQRVIVTRTDHDFVDLTIATSHPGRGPPAKLTTTATHPFYDITQSAFVDAAHLRAGDKLQRPDGHTATIKAVHRYHTTQVTYDLTINGLHTYYVEAGTSPVLVHNCDDLALGVQDAPGGGLTAFARKLGAKHYGPPDRAKGQDNNYWRAPVEKFIGQGNGTIHVNMDGLRDGFTDMVKRGLRPALYEGSATDEEMSWIARSVVNGQRSWSSIRFYEGGKNLQMPMPDWSSMMEMRRMDEPLDIGWHDGG